MCACHVCNKLLGCLQIIVNVTHDSLIIAQHGNAGFHVVLPLHEDTEYHPGHNRDAIYSTVELEQSSGFSNQPNHDLDLSEVLGLSSMDVYGTICYRTGCHAV